MAILGTNTTANMFNEFKVKSIVVAAGTATTTATDDADIIGGLIVGVYPTAGTAADKILNSVSAITSTGGITITLGGNTTANHTFAVVIKVASGKLS